MRRVVAIGNGAALAGYALVGVDVVDAQAPELVRRAWTDAVGGSSLVLLTAEARALLPDRLERSVPWTVIPG